MKILTIAATAFFSSRGGHMRILNEAKYLRELGAEVRLCAYHIGENVPGLDIARIYGSRRYKKTSPGFSWGKIWLDLKMLFLVRREIKKFQPDVIHAHLWEGLAIGYLAKRMACKKIPIVFDLQGDLKEEFENYNKKNSCARKIFVGLAKIVVKWADKIVVSSEKVICRCPTPTTIIRDGIDLDLFSNPAKLSEGEQKKIDEITKWKADKKLLVYIGGLSDSKGVGELLKAFGEIAVQNGEWKMLVGGFGNDEEKYKKFVEEKKLQNLIYLSGKVEYFSLPTYMALADAAIDPKNSSSESSGKLVNLMATSLPIVCFDNDFNRSRLGEKGYFMRSFDDLGEILAKINGRKKIEYDLQNISQRKEVQKLMSIFRLLTK